MQKKKTTKNNITLQKQRHEKHNITDLVEHITENLNYAKKHTSQSIKIISIEITLPGTTVLSMSHARTTLTIIDQFTRFDSRARKRVT